MEVKPSLAQGLQKSVGTLWKGDDFSDFTVVVDGTSFQCHRFILSACSDFFQALFRSQMRECQENNAELQGMTASTFDVIIKSVYRGVDGLTKDSVLDVWSATEQLQIRYLIEECKNFAINNVTVDNCFSFLREANLYSAEKVVTSSLVFISENFEQLIEIENLLQLSFADFYKVIESDYLIASSEDVVVETVLKWVDYTHLHSSDCTSNCKEPHNSNNLNVSYTNCNNVEINNSASSTMAEVNLVSDLDSNITKINESNITVDDSRENEASLTGETSTNILCARESQPENNNGQSTFPGKESGQTGSLSESFSNSKDIIRLLSSSMSNSDSAEVVPGHCQEVCQNDILVKDQSKMRDRKQHLFTLISKCRLYLTSSSRLDSLLHSPTLVSCQEALNLVSDTMMYKLCVGRRHDSWPQAAVHRVVSVMKHVMVFMYYNNFMAYNLNTGSVHEFADLPEDYYSSSFSFTVFDNVLYLGYRNDKQNKTELHMFANQSWEKVNDVPWTNFKSFKCPSHDTCIYYLDHSRIYYCQCVSGHSRKWYLLCNLNRYGDIAVFFERYILVFYTELNNSVGVLCYNIKTKQILSSSSSIDGTSVGMVSFTHLGDVYLLQRNGSLWKIFSTDTDLFDFELVSKLWDEDLDLKGCVVYRKELFVFHQESNPIVPPVTEILLGSVPDLLIKIRMVAVDSHSSCLPMVLPQSWFIVKDSK